MPPLTARIPYDCPGLPAPFRRPSEVQVARPPAETTVAVMTSELTGTGRQKSSVDLATALAMAGYRSVCLARPKQPVPDAARAQLAEAGAILEIVKPGRSYIGRTSWRITSALRRLRPDVIVEYSADALVALLVARRLFGRPKLIFANRGFHLPAGVMRTLTAAALRRVEATACVSAAVATLWNLGMPDMPHDRTWVTYDGVQVPPAESYPSQAAARQAVGLPLDARILGAVGCMVPTKGHRFLIAALPEVVQTVPEARVVIVGDGPLEPELREQAAAAGVGDRVHFLGWRNDVPQILPAFDVFAHTSRVFAKRTPPSIEALHCPALGGEAFARAYLEAMAASLPIIATESGGNAEVVVPGQNGLLVPSEDVAAITSAAVRLLSDLAEARRMGQVSRARAVNEFSLQALGQQYHFLIQTLFGGEPAD